jgi:DNA-binding NarL/FixJ family response regulator
MALKYGMHDGFMCPVGGRWLIAFWSSKELSHTLTPAVRVMVFSAASLAAIRLEQLTGPDADRLGTFIRVKPQELAILRFLSFGRTVEEIAKLLAIDEDTVETSLIKTQMKLNARNQTHAVAEAIRQNMIS